VAVRRRWPLAALGVVVAASAFAVLAGVIPTVAALPLYAALALALYAVALAEPTRRSLPALAAGLAGAVVVGVITAGTIPSAYRGESLGPVPLVVLMVVAPWVAGRAVRDRRAVAARSAEQLTRQAVTDERLRIAREMHDVVAHSMSLIAVRAAIANHVADARPEATGEALRVIEDTSRHALTEMRQLLGVLRSANDEPGDLDPAAGLAALPELARRAAAAGVRVDLDLRGLTGLPDGVGRSVYRIVQEAVTNVVRHAAPAYCSVSVAADEREIRIEVTDDGPAVRPHSPESGGTGGHGLIGIRERVVLYGGTFHAAPRPAGGFRVSACLPCAAVPQPTQAAP
jgi:signal transduction histidine kinase